MEKDWTKSDKSRKKYSKSMEKEWKKREGIF